MNPVVHSLVQSVHRLLLQAEPGEHSHVANSIIAGDDAEPSLPAYPYPLDTPQEPLDLCIDVTVSKQHSMLHNNKA